MDKEWSIELTLVSSSGLQEFRVAGCVRTLSDHAK
jgi:hypothetical protein